QRPDGSWGSAHKTKYLNIFAPGRAAHKSFKVATSGLCLLALLKTPGESDAKTKAIDFGVKFLLENSKQAKRASAAWIGNVWSHTYTIKAFLELKKQGKEYDGVDELIKYEISRLETYQFLDGGWGYYDFKSHTSKPSGSSTAFLTGSCLIVLDLAKEAGFEVPEKSIKRALAFLKKQRKPDNSFLYSNDFKFSTNVHINKKVGSLARTQVSLRALYEMGDKVEKLELEEWVNLIIKRNMWLDMARKRPIPHESWNKIASYFYYYGMYYAAENLELCESKKNLGLELGEILVSKQEKNGSWFDFPLYDYGHAYGTAYALLGLSACTNAID
ncbi:MAG: terpene cyclase/mutase family protein, partial [Lentisphaeraceae bacterium]|nr:terpene cyclase/mutase family protein [Lentisphaeraceae bacterium]